jgi:hypothetical protein
MVTGRTHYEFGQSGKDAGKSHGKSGAGNIEFDDLCWASVEK